MSKTGNLTKAQKAAAILVAMGKPSAGRLLKFFKQEELKALIEAARMLRTIPQGELEKIVAEFEGEFTEGAGLLDSGDTMDNILNDTLTPEEVKAIMAGGSAPAGDVALPVWPRLEQLPAERLRSILESEHPQTAALILSNLRPAAAASTLKTLPRSIRGEVAKRMMTLSAVPETARQLVEEQMRQKVDEAAGARDNSAGQLRVASILNELDKSDLEEVMDEMADAGAQGLDALRSRLFSFEDIPLLSQRSRVALFDTISAETTTLSLRGASPELVEAVLSSIGARTRRMIEAELKDAVGNVSADDVNTARRNIASAAVRLSSEGSVELPSLQDVAA